MTALIYEYTRSSPPLVGAIRKWQAQVFDRKLLSAIEPFDENKIVCTAIRHLPEATNAQVIGLIVDPDDATGDPAAKELLHWHLELGAKTALGPTVDTSIALRFTDLHEPWATLQNRGAQYLATRCLSVPRRDVGILFDLGPARTYEHYLRQNPMLQHGEFIINWAVPISDIVDDFKKWAKETQPPTATKFHRRPGKRARWQRLKWLAAYRIANFGYRDHGSALKFLRQHACLRQGDDPRKVLPRYPYEKSWDDAVANAQNLLDGDFVRSIKSLFDAQPVVPADDQEAKLIFS